MAGAGVCRWFAGGGGGSSRGLLRGSGWTAGDEEARLEAAAASGIGAGRVGGFLCVCVLGIVLDGWRVSLSRGGVGQGHDVLQGPCRTYAMGCMNRRVAMLSY